MRSLILGIALGSILFVSQSVDAAGLCCRVDDGIERECAFNQCFSGICNSQCTTQKNGIDLEIPYYDDLADAPFNLADPGVNGVAQAVTRSLQFLFAGVGFAFLVYLLYGGFLIISGRGEPTAVQTGKNVITRAIIGLLIMFMSFWMVQLMETVLGLEILTGDGIDEPILNPLIDPDLPAALVALNEPPSGVTNWGYQTRLVATLPYDGTQYAGARICFNKGNAVTDYRNVPLLAYGEVRPEVLGAQLAQGIEWPPGWSLIAEPESSCQDILFDENFEPPGGAINPVYIDPRLQVSWEVMLEKNTAYQWQVGAWVVGVDGKLNISDYSPVARFETGAFAHTPATPTPAPTDTRYLTFDFNVMTYNFPFGNPQKLREIADLMTSRNVSVAFFQEFTDEENAKETMLQILREKEPSWQMISTKYDDAKLTDSYTIYSKWPLRDLNFVSLNLERKAVTAVTDTPAGPLRLFNLHTSTRMSNSQVCAQLQGYIDFMQKVSRRGEAYVLAGDFNAELNDLSAFPECANQKQWFLDNHSVSCVSAPEDSSGQCGFSHGDFRIGQSGRVIDYILTPRNTDISLQQAAVGTVRFASEDEHYPVFGNVRLRGIVSQPNVSHVLIYPLHRFDQVDTRIEANLNEKSLPFVLHKTFNPSKGTEFYSTRARFAASGQQEVRIRTNWFKNPELRGIGTIEKIRQENGEYVLVLPKPGHYYVVNQGTEEKMYLWYDDAKTIQKPTQNVVNVRDAGIISDTSRDQGDRLQNLITNCPVNCVLYFPAGEYRTHRLNVHRDNISLYIDGGAIIKGMDDINASISPEFGKNLFHIAGKNITIDGPGTIDGNMAYDAHILDIEDAQSIILRNVLLMDSDSWSVHMKKSKDIRINNLKIFSGKDGLDIDSTSKVLVDTIFVESIDDNIPVKTRYEGIATNDVLVKNCMVKARKSSLKIGTENRAAISNIIYDTCEVIDGQRALNIAPNQPERGPISNITFKNIRIYMSGALDGESGYAIRGENGGASVNNILYENIVMMQVKSNTFDYSADVNNMRVYLQTPWESRPAVFYTSERSSTIRMNNVNVYYFDQKSQWGDLTGGGQFVSNNVREVVGSTNIPPMVLWP